MKIVHNWLDIIQNKLFPPTCILCVNAGMGSQDLCSSCYQRMPRNNLCCYRCAEIFDTAIAVPALCGRCLSETPAFDETYAPFIHKDEIRYLITGLKFGSQFKNARLLGSLLAEYVDKSAKKPDCIIPVPLHKSSYRELGFNQALESARTVSRILQIPVDFTSFIR